MSISVIPNEKPSRSLSEFEYLHNPDSKEARLGKGSFAHVKLVKEKVSGKLLALKSVDVELKNATKSDMHNLRTEILVHRELDHPNIIKFHTYLVEEGRVYIILDYAQRGNLYSYMHKNKSLPINYVFKFFYQACCAINYLHQKDILHRDIKPENLLLDNELNIKLCDFGWAARSIKDKRTTFCGTYEYMAPELVAKSTYNYKVDVWSLGILLYELSHNEAPYKGRTLDDIKVSINRETIHFNPTIQPELKDLITCILQKDPEQRPEITEILNHTWVRQNLAKLDANYKNAAAASELQQPGQQQTQASNSTRPQSAPMNKDHKSRAVSTPRNINDENIAVPKISSFGLLHRQMSENRAPTKDNKDSVNVSKETINQGYMTPSHKTQSTTYATKEISRQDSMKYSSPLSDKTASGLSLSSAQKNFSEDHSVHYQNDLNNKNSKIGNFQLGKPAKSATRGMENDATMTPEKQKTQELIMQSQMTRSFLARRQNGVERVITKENMHGHNLSLGGYAQDVSGFNSTRHAYTTASNAYENTNYDNFSQAVSTSEVFKSANKANNAIAREFSNGTFAREPMSAGTKLVSRMDYPSEMQRSANKANFSGRLKRDGVKLDVQRFYPYGANANINTNSPSQVALEINSAGINYSKPAWGQQPASNGSPYVYSRADSNGRLNYSNTSNASYGSFSGNFAYAQASQSPYKATNSPIVERHIGRDIREGGSGYKLSRSNTAAYMN